MISFKDKATRHSIYILMWNVKNAHLDLIWMSFYFIFSNRHVSKNDPHKSVFKSHGNRVTTQ